MTTYICSRLHTFRERCGERSQGLIEKKINVMRKTYHLCLSAGDEVMFRDLEDYNRGFNCFAVALYKTNSTGLVESFMSTHMHLLVQTDSPKDFMMCLRIAYIMYFNKKYGHSGKLGEKLHFTMEVVGYHHILAAMSYILRNALHHGVTPIPYAYPHCSANAIFMQEMGKRPEENLLPQKAYYKHLGRSAEYPGTYKMSKIGVFLRESVLDIPQVENLFVTPRSFNFYMTRKSSEEWMEEQKKDANGAEPVSLTSIEKGVNLHSLDSMLIFENGKADYRKLSDIDLCTEIDRNILPNYGKTSVYQLSSEEKERIANHLRNTLHLNAAQIRRCLAML